MAELKIVKTKFDYDKLGNFEKELYRDYSEDLQQHDDAISDFDAYEAMHAGKVFDSTSKQTKNGITDSSTATIYLERAARVAGQLPEGEVKAFGKKDYGKALFMDLLRKKWIYPNANAQRSFRTKMFLWQYGSSQYGFMPMYYDLNVSPSGYFGPDCWLWNPRNFIPQAGFTTVSEMDYCHALAYKSPRFFEDLLEEDDGDWDKEAIKEVIDQIKNAKKETDEKRDTKQVRDRTKQPVRQVCVATRYEAGEDGRWITFLPDFNCKVIRSIKNPHKNGRIPFVIKPCIPDFSSFYNVGDFQRSQPMQAVNDGLDNFYFEGIKINLNPLIMVNGQTVVRQTMDLDPGSVWEFTGPPDAKRLETSTAGLGTYQAAKGMAKGALQSIAGVTDTRVNAEDASDPGFSKTPEGLRQIKEREATRDGQDREFLEEAMKELIDGMLSLIPTISNRIPIDLFEEEVKDIIKAGHTDIVEIFQKSKENDLLDFQESESEQQLRIKINPTKLQGLEYRFELEPNSTEKKTKEAQLQSMLEWLGFIGKMPNMLQEYTARTGKTLSLEAINNVFATLTDIPGMDQMFVPVQQAAGGDTPPNPDAPPDQTPQPTDVGAQPAPEPANPGVPAQNPAPPAPVMTPNGQVAGIPGQTAVQVPAPVLRPDGQPFSDPELEERARQILALRGTNANQ